MTTLASNFKTLIRYIRFGPRFDRPVRRLDLSGVGNWQTVTNAAF